MGARAKRFRPALRVPRAAWILPVLALLGALATTAPATAATITIVNNDGFNEGFNDPTVVAPVGGNPGTTRGAQRLFVFQTAAAIWGSILPSDVEIRVNAQFNPLTCTAMSAALGGTSTVAVFSDFPNAEFPATWYHVSLANRVAGVDLDPGLNDMNSQFNSTLDNGTCLGGLTWYYGIDGSEGSQIELLPVVLHELGHGLGFSQFSSLTTGQPLAGQTDIYQRFMLDRTSGLAWNQMTNGQRVASAINTGNVVWTGPAVTFLAPSTLGVRTEVRVTAPPGIAGSKVFGTAAFGPSVSAATISGQVALMEDGFDPTSDGCTPDVGGLLAGKIALIDRGTCTFVEKVGFAEAAGAIAVIIVNNVSGSPPLMGGDDPGLGIPAVSVTMADGNAIRAQLGTGVFVTMGPNPAFLAGADDEGRVRLYAPNPVELGSSISHFDVVAAPNLLMEPFINDDLSSTVDLTKFLFEDIGWFDPRTTDAVRPPLAVRLHGNWPNPFVSMTSIRFDLGQPGHAAIDVFDASGRRIRRVLDADLPAGANQARWDGTDAHGARVSPGVYFYRLEAEGSAFVRRTIVLSGSTTP